MKNQRTVRRVGLLASVALASLIVGGLVAEIGVRLVRPVRTDDLLPLPYNHEAVRRLAAGDTYLRFDPVLGWTTGPSARGNDKGAIYRTNSAGIRSDREFSVEPRSGMRRLSAFGDSFTHCEEVDYADCWTSQLERAWLGPRCSTSACRRMVRIRPGFVPNATAVRTSLAPS